MKFICNQSPDPWRLNPKLLVNHRKVGIKSSKDQTSFPTLFLCRFYTANSQHLLFVDEKLTNEWLNPWLCNLSKTTTFLKWVSNWIFPAVVKPRWNHSFNHQRLFIIRFVLRFKSRWWYDAWRSQKRYHRLGISQILSKLWSTTVDSYSWPLVFVSSLYKVLSKLWALLSSALVCVVLPSPLHCIVL